MFNEANLDAIDYEPNVSQLNDNNVRNHSVRTFTFRYL